jgi:hypothetical protein
MQLACAPCDTAGDGLGFWGELFSTALQAGASVYGTKQQTKLQTAQLKQQLDIERARLASEQQARALQAQIASMQGMATLPPALPMGQGGTGQAVLVPSPSGGYDVVLDNRSDALPSWAIPAGIGAGALVLALLLRR